MDRGESFHLEGLHAGHAAAGKFYFEFLRRPSLSCGLYLLPAGGTDPQTPHAEDEIYVVLRGRATLRTGDTETAVEPGSVVFVPARVEHRFRDIREELEALVFFAPAEGTRSAPSRKGARSRAHRGSRRRAK